MKRHIRVALDVGVLPPAAAGAAGAAGRRERHAGPSGGKGKARDAAPDVAPMNRTQELLLGTLRAAEPPIVIVTGPAGSSKSYCATVVGLRKLLDGEVKKLVITRPVAPIAGEDIGYLPGSLNDKLGPWVTPILETMLRFLSPAKLQELMDEKAIELCAIGMCRGRTFSDSWIILDEAQSCQVSAFKAVITRIGVNSKLVIAGDEEQSDIAGVNGLSDFLRRVGDGVPGEIEVVRFTAADVVRHPVIKTVLSLYGDAVRR